jgi:hypothetical protein
MSPRVLLLAAALVALTLAGCSSPPPSGTIVDAHHALALEGSAAIDYQPFEGGNPGGQAPVVGGQLQCAHGGVPGGPVPPCRGPWSDFRVNVTLPLAIEGAYTVHAVNATGSTVLLELAETDARETTALYAGAKNFTEDLTGRYTTLELRLGSFLLATAPAGEGPQAFTVAPAAQGVQTTATWEARTIRGSVTGLQPNVTYRGNLYLPADGGGVQMMPTEWFTIAPDGSFEYTSEARDISAFVEFHVHVGASKVNLFKATIQTAET